MPDVRKIQDLQSPAMENLTFTRWIVGIGYRKETIEFYFIFNDGEKYQIKSKNNKIQQYKEYFMKPEGAKIAVMRI
jgi:hypothetical protein